MSPGCEMIKNIRRRLREAGHEDSTHSTSWQEGALCAQHCLNALLQGQYFSPVDLADIGRQLDEHERERMAEAGLNTEEYQKFVEQPSHNYDDSGFFSIQVISNAVSVWGVDLIQYNSQHASAVAARQDPTKQTAFICNFREHWFTIRKLGNQWFNLNSLLTGPELVSDTYLALLLTQLQQEGYSIFIVVGSLPECEADQLLKLIPAVQPIKPKLTTDKSAASSCDQAGESDGEVKKAMDESKNLLDSDDAMLQQTLQRSMEGYLQEEIERIEQATSEDTGQTGSTDSYDSDMNLVDAPNSQESNKTVQIPSQEQLRLKRQAFLDRISKLAKGEECQDNGTESDETLLTSRSDGASSSVKERHVLDELTEDEMLQQALKMSMDGQ